MRIVVNITKPDAKEYHSFETAVPHEAIHFVHQHYRSDDTIALSVFADTRDDVSRVLVILHNALPEG